MKAYFVSLSLAAFVVACGGSDNSGGGGAGAGSGAGGDASCQALPIDDCLSCCASDHVEGQSTYQSTVEACACGMGACAGHCSTLCAGGDASEDCATCVNTALSNGTCSTDPCASDAACQAYSACGSACVNASMTTSTTASSMSTASSGSDAFAQARHDCVAAINTDRATLGLPAYAEWTADETCTDGQAQADQVANTPHSAFGTCGESAQDECPGWPGPADAMITQCLAMMWAEGPGADFETHGHYINMSSTSYTMVSCGFYTLADGSVWATQDFK